MELEAIRSRVKELFQQHCIPGCSSETSCTGADRILEDFILQLDRESARISEEFSVLGLLGCEDLDECIEHVKKEISSVEECNAKISEDINVLNETIVGESVRVERDLEQFHSDLGNFASQGLENLQDGATLQDLINGGFKSGPSDARQLYNFEILELDHLIEKKSSTLSVLEDLDCVVQRVKLFEQIDDIVSDVKVIELEGNCIRLSIKTFVPISESRLIQRRQEFLSGQSVVDHELLIELTDGTLQLQTVKIFPDDVFIREVVDAAKLRRQSSLPLTLEMQLSLGWLIRKIQERIRLSSLRALIVKDANRSRNWLTRWMFKSAMTLSALSMRLSKFLFNRKVWHSNLVFLLDSKIKNFVFGWIISSLDSVTVKLSRLQESKLDSIPLNVNCAEILMT
ncbi:uncharacterized protein [Aristolochia californica]|uniref:uncharacterized protein isoform X2 n=1 Tax=Aristolochia californica TaxID=171875 RepID=UPI0035DA06D3